jgi:methylated-DNA-[protein]-cysteine S-methyltransferase
MARNPLPILIPCHRVILSSGKIGGFMGKANRADIKTKLITLESSSVLNNLYE